MEVIDPLEGGGGWERRWVAEAFFWVRKRDSSSWMRNTWRRDTREWRWGGDGVRFMQTGGVSCFVGMDDIVCEDVRINVKSMYASTVYYVVN
jgi:hypothetical protein